ncbi:hypothetical protein Sjap_025856 [Stephania japonica]|uniref:Pentatricopeptide repeat-containing protein n=1 Tax=Stephania japonica TaxID=461633 RepID=A0AAP0E513_9MAGN
MKSNQRFEDLGFVGFFFNRRRNGETLHRRNPPILPPLRPRSRLKPSFDALLAHTFQNPNPNSLPLALAILQQSLRSGCLPAPQTRLSLSAAWLRRRRRGASVAAALTDMRSVGSGSGYRPDVGTCNYLVECLCKVDELDEAGRVLGEMGRVGCDPDSESYGLVVGGMCGARRAGEAVRLVREMVGAGVVPRQGTAARVVAAMRADGDVGRAVEVVDGLEREGIRVGFEGYEGLVEGCVEMGEFVLGSRVLGEMVERGFVPYVRVRQRLVEGLVGVGEVELACFVRQKLGEVRS